MTKTEPSLSAEALAKAKALGIEMAERDSWIEPVFEDGDEAEDFGEFSMHHRETWEQTCQFEILWGDRLTTLTEDDAEAQGVDRTENWELWYYEFQCPAKDALWEAWEEKRKLYEFWEKARKAPAN